MYEYREKVSAEGNFELKVFTNPQGVADGINPLDHGSEIHTDIMKTQALKIALSENKYDLAFGGARRDEEKSRAKERIFSFRSERHEWDPKKQRPELWNNFNARKKQESQLGFFPYLIGQN